MIERLTGLNLLEPSMRFGDVNDEFRVLACRLVGEDQFGFNTAFAKLEYASNNRNIWMELVRINVQNITKGAQIELDVALGIGRETRIDRCFWIGY